MAITPKSPSTVSAPNTLTQESAASVAVPNTLTQESAASVAVPNTLTQESAASVAVPNTLTQESAASVAIPNTLTQESAASVAVPNTLTQESAATVAVPNTLTQESAAGFPRCLTPKIAFDFADEKYSLCGDPKALSDITTYSRASSATFVNRRVDGCTGDYEYFVDTDYVGSVTNLLTYSEQFDNADWTKSAASVTANNALDPNGNRTAEKIVEDSTAAQHQVRQSVSVTSGNDYTFSVYAKKDERSKLSLVTNSAGFPTTGRVTFDLSSGVVVDNANDLIVSISHTGNDWYLCTIMQTSNATTTANFDIELYNGSESYTGDGSSGLYIWGAQLTESVKPLPYVQTTTASASETFSESVRIEYDPATGDSLGALIEGASTNLCLRSEEFDNASWTKINSSITANDAIAPDGTKSADKYSAASTASIFPEVTQSVSSTVSSKYTSSYLVKAAEASFVQILYSGGDVANNPRANFNIAIGELGTVDADITAAIKDVGNGWFRISSTVTAADTALLTSLAIIGSATDSRLQANSWTAGDGIYIWGAQVEELPFPSSYIRTEGSSVSRSSDNLTSAYNHDAFKQISVHASYQQIGDKPSESQRVWALRDSPLYAGIIHTSGAIRYYVGSDLVTGNSVTLSSFSKFTSVYNSGTGSIYEDGVLSASSSVNPDAGDIDTLSIGSTVSGSNHLHGHIKELVVYDKALSAKEVELL